VNEIGFFRGNEKYFWTVGNVMRSAELQIKNYSLIMGKFLSEKLIKIFLCRKFAAI